MSEVLKFSAISTEKIRAGKPLLFFLSLYVQAKMARAGGEYDKKVCCIPLILQSHIPRCTDG